MKRILLVLLLLCTFNVLHAQTAIGAAAPVKAADPWKHGTNEYILDGNYSRQADGHWRGTVTSAWAHFATDNTEVGSIGSFRSVLTAALNGSQPQTVQGAGVGGFYEYNLPFGAKDKGHWFVGGDTQYLTGDLKALSTYTYSTRAGRKWHVGKSAAVRLSFDFNRAGNQGSGAALNQEGVNLGISVGSS